MEANAVVLSVHACHAFSCRPVSAQCAFAVEARVLPEDKDGSIKVLHKLMQRLLQIAPCETEITKPAGLAMNSLTLLGRMLIVLGVILTLVGIYLVTGPKLPGILSWLGRLPGDIRIEGAHGSFYFPLTTCLLISAVLSFLFWIFGRWGG